MLKETSVKKLADRMCIVLKEKNNNIAAMENGCDSRDIEINDVSCDEEMFEINDTKGDITIPVNEIEAWSEGQDEYGCTVFTIMRVFCAGQERFLQLTI